MEKLYIEQGELFARRIVEAFYRAPVIRQDNAYYVLLDENTGKALSPVCTGERGAWRWAGFMIHACKRQNEPMPNFLDATMVELPVDLYSKRR